MLTTSRRFVVRLLLVLSLFGVLSATTFETTPAAHAGLCVGAPSGNCTSLANS